MRSSMTITKDSENLYSSMRFVGDGVTKRVPLTFDLREGDGLAVDFGEGLVTSGYLIDYDVTPVVVLFSEPLPKGKTITIRRLTKIDTVKHVFQYTGNAQGGADFSAKNVDENFEQITRASQDAMDSQTLATETLEDMAGIRDEALEAKESAKESADEAKSYEQGAKVAQTEANKSALQAGASAQSAKDSENLAKAWATNPEDVVVQDGEFSAKHWAGKAKEIANFDPANYRKKDDLLFKGMMQVQATDDVGTGVFLLDKDGNPRGQMTHNSGGLQFAQHTIDGKSLTYTLPSVDGELIVEATFKEHVKAEGLTVTTNNRNIKLGRDGLNIGTNSYGLVAIGKEALQDNDNVQHSVAIGEGAMKHATNTRYNLAIGHESLLNTTGDRNIALGSNSLRFNTTGYGNTAVGRNCLQNSTKGYYNVAVGLGCLTSSAPVGLDGKTILNTSPLESNSQTAVGVNALNRSLTSGNTALGMNAGKSVTISEGVFIGKDAGLMIDSSTGYTGKVYVSLDIPSLALNKVDNNTLSITNAELAGSLQLGFVAEFNVTDFDRQFLKVKSVEGSTVLFESPTVPSREQYIVKLVGYETLTRGTATRNTFIGTSAGKATTKGLNTFIGFDAGASATGDNCVAVGDASLANADGNRNTAIGKSAMQQVKGSFNTAVGYQAGNNANNNNSNDFFGNLAGADTPETVSNVSCIGNRSNVTGSNQVQLGNADTTTYVYGTVQNRSDARDKKDIVDLSLGLDFVMKLKPKQFKWDYREWKGKKTGKRDHVGFIAQDLQEALQDTNYAFVQDHSVNGGSDVLSVGYDEFIGVLTKAIQEQQKQIEELKSTIAKLK